MAIGSFPGLNERGYKDPTSIGLPTFASAAARDTWVTAQGGIANIPTGFACFITGTNVISVNNAGTWRSTVALT
jgi:hypothetical protein